jgi:energy-converting hydrogenase Eha subunit A
MKVRVHARAAGVAAAAILLPLLASCRPTRDDLSTAWRFPLPAEAAGATTITVDGAGRVWLGVAGQLVVADSAGAVTGAAIPGGEDVPSVAAVLPGALLVRTGPELVRVDAADGSVGARWRYAELRATAPDPGGRWVYAANSGGGVLRLDAATLEVLGGWPEVGADAVGAAVSALGDRVYVSLAPGEGSDAPAAIHVRDAQSGRVVGEIAQPEAAFDPVAAADGRLFACTEATAVAYRHVPRGLERDWERPVDLLRGEGGCALRIGDGGRLAVFSRGEGGGLVLLDAADGRVLGQTPRPPLDAAFGPGGRLYVLEGPSVRVVR